MRPAKSLLALAVLAAGLLVTGMVVFYEKASAERAGQRAFQFASDEVRFHVIARLRACAQVLRSAASLFDAAGSVSREQWRVFNQGLQLEQHLPGIQGVGFAQWIPRAEIAEHVQAIRREGFPGYRVWPAGDREAYTSIIYLEPFTNRNLRQRAPDRRGFDAGNPAKREAL